MDCPMFCVCDRCSRRIAAEHRRGDERFGRDWRGGHGCGCYACKAYRKVLDDIDAGFGRVTEAERKLESFREARRAFEPAPAQDAPAVPLSAHEVNDRLATIIDEAFGRQPVMSPCEMLSFLERKLFEDRQKLAAAERERDEAVNRMAEFQDKAVAAERERCRLWAAFCRNGGCNEDTMVRAIRDGLSAPK